MKCPRCNNEGEENNSICLNCGFDFTEISGKTKTNQSDFIKKQSQEKNQENNKKKKLIFYEWWFCLIIISLLVIIISLTISYLKQKNMADNGDINNTTVSQPVTKKSLKNFQTTNFKEVINMPYFLELSFNEAIWTEKVLPSVTSGFYSYLEDVDEEIYFAVKGYIKNINSNEIFPENIVATALFNDKLEYKMQIKAEGEDGSDFYCFSLEPFKRTNIYFVISVPYEIRAEFSKCEITFGFDNQMQFVDNKGVENLPHKFVLVIED